MTSFEEMTPRLIVRDANAAIAFYVRAFGAKEVMRFADPKRDGLIVHAELTIGDNTVTLAEEHEPWGLPSPLGLQGKPVLLHLRVSDADATGRAMTEAGAEEVIPIANQFYGAREGRFRDPQGHLWIISQHVEDLSAKEIGRRMS